MRFVKWTVSLFLLVLLLLLAGLWFLLGTETGYRQLPELVNRFTPFTVNYAEMQGKLLGRQQWRDVHISGAGTDIRLGAAEMDFSWQDLFSKQLHIPALHIRDGVVKLPSGDEKDTQPSGTIPEQLPQIRPPLDVEIERLTLENIGIFKEEQSLVHIDDAQAKLQYLRDGQAHVQAEVRMREGQGSLTAQVMTVDDYPLDLTAQGRLTLAGQAPAEIEVQGTGSVLAPSLRVNGKGLLDIAAQLDGKVDLKAQTLSVQGAWQDVAYGDMVAAKKGDIALEGTFASWAVKLNSDVSGKDIPPAEIAVQAQVDAQQLHDAEILIKTLGGELALQGEAAWQDGLSWQMQLRADGIDGRTFSDTLDVALDGDIRSKGRLQGAALEADVDIVSLHGQWQKHPVRGQGSVAVRGTHIDVHDFLLEVAGNRLEGNGTLGESNADLHLAVQADHLDRIVPMIRGKIAAKGTVKGNILNPELDVNATWADLGVGDKIVEKSSGTLHGKGRWQDLAITLDGSAQGRDFPALAAKGSTRVRFEGKEGRAEAIDMNIKTLEGDVHATGSVVFMPEVRWDIVAQTKGINPQGYADGLKGKVDAKIVSKGSVIDGKLAMDNRLENLGGQWQGQKLGGNGGVTMQDGKLSFNGVALAVGSNQIKLDGHIHGDTLDVRFDLDGKKLADFDPRLGGTLQGKGTLKGKTASPHIQADMQGRALSFGDYRAERVEARLDSLLQPGGALNNQIRLSNVQAAGQKWAQIQLDSEGRFEAHSLRLRASGGDINGELGARGGLQGTDSWRGTLERLQVNGQGLEWALQKPAAVSVSPQAVDIKDFCLADKHSGLCLNLAHANTTELRYDIRKIDPQSFVPFIPKTLSIGTSLSGRGHIRIDAAGKMLGEATIQAAPGKIVIRPPKQAPIALDLREGKLETAFTANEARSRLNVDFGSSGNLQGTLVIKDYRALGLDGRVQVHIPDIGRFAYLVPKVSELKGKINGDLLIGGSAAKPQVSGQIVMDGGALKIPEYATELRDIRMNLKAERSGQIDINGRIGTPEGHLDANGALYLQPLRMNLNLAGNNMLIADSKTMRVIVSPKFDITIDPDSGINVDGKVDVPEARIDIPDTSGGESISEDVIIVTDAHDTNSDIIAAPSATPMRATIAVRLGDKVYFANKDMKIKLTGGLDIGIRPGQPVTGRGTIEVASGYYELYGQELNIQRGRANFSGNIANPSVEVLALREIEDVKVGARVSGTARNLRLDLTSEPGMPDSAILSYLLFGRAPDGAMDSTALMQTAASVGLKGIVPGDLANETGLDVFDVGVTGLKAGKYLSDKIYVGMRSNFFTGVTEFLARYQFNKRMSMEVTSQGGNTAVDFLYQFEKD